MPAKKPDTFSIEPIVAKAHVWQQPLIEQLLGLKHQHKLPHAILIELGTQVDSQSLGWYLVSALVCHHPQGHKPCGSCPACELMKANNYPDFTFTTLEENDKTNKLNKDIKIDQIRRLIHQISLTDSLQAGKFALIYPAEKMNLSAANSLLKTLEEPSANSTLILMTHNSGRLPVTIRSRCQRWSINNPDPQTAQTWLLEQGMEQAQIKDYLKLAQADAELSLELYQQDFKQQLDRFFRLVEDFLSDQLEVTAVTRELTQNDNHKIRLMVKKQLQKQIDQLVENPLSNSIKLKLQALIKLMKQSEQTLQIEDNNLNLQLQLEDVLISMKQIINRG